MGSSLVSLTNQHAPQLDGGCAVISNTMICEAARLISGHRTKRASRIPPWLRGKNSITDLFSVIDSVVLHDRLYTLPCRHDADTHGLDLREALVQDGILVELDTALSRKYREPDYWWYSTRHRTRHRRRLANWNSNRLRQESAQGTRSISQRRVGTRVVWRSGSDKMLGPMKLTDTFEYPVSGGVAAVLKTTRFDDLARQLVGWMDYSSSGAYEACTTVLRDMYYIYAAEVFNLPYWPQSTRIDFAKAFPNYFDKGIRTELYGKLAQGFSSTLNDIEEVFGKYSSTVPPFAALALSRVTNREELTIRILELRQEYASLRENLTAIEAARLHARTLHEKKEWLERRQKLLDEASRIFSQPHTLSFESVVR